eukprot:366259-Chlamydomonas_euryale.AAC.5
MLARLLPPPRGARAGGLPQCGHVGRPRALARAKPRAMCRPKHVGCPATAATAATAAAAAPRAVPGCYAPSGPLRLASGPTRTRLLTGDAAGRCGRG